MVWSKHTDGIATHPRTMALASRTDERLRWEAFGFYNALVSMSAQHMTDYSVDEHTVALLGGSRAQVLVRTLRRAGLITGATTIDGVRHHLLLDDPEYVHLRRKSEVEWEKQRREDHRNPDLTVPVRLRDGDGCRYCGQIVSWRARRGKRGGTYDHRVPGQPSTEATCVVACLGCNATRGDDLQADDRVPLLSPPAEPYYSQDTVDFLARHGVQVAVSTDPAPAAAAALTGTTSDPAASRAPLAPSDPAASRVPLTASQDAAASSTQEQLPAPSWAVPAEAPPTTCDLDGAPADPPPTTCEVSPTAPPVEAPPTTCDLGSAPPAPPTASAGRRPGRSGQVDGLHAGTGRDGSGRSPGAPSPATRPPDPPPPTATARRPRGRRSRTTPGAT